MSRGEAGNKSLALTRSLAEPWPRQLALAPQLQFSRITDPVRERATKERGEEHHRIIQPVGGLPGAVHEVETLTDSTTRVEMCAAAHRRMRPQHVVLQLLGNF